ncbi:hypothetical protein NDU88_001897 [Pleurodeles waltl]|uniref:Uncharacterized protein n=1 Tax=Pleurodeles waltl TaxID=8319 RepID=A0AAV7KTU8_PLEWA|nr:hypothetical protein NDU88_001897 [Pleurodeles waltl]
MRLGVGARPLTGPPPARVPCAGWSAWGELKPGAPGGRESDEAGVLRWSSEGQTMRCWTRGPGERPGESEPRERGSPA